MSTHNDHKSSPMIGDESFLLRWRGKAQGPYQKAAIAKMFASHQVGLLHEISYDGQWITLREYFSIRDAITEAERAAAETARQQAASALQSGLSEGTSRRLEVLESALLSTLRPRYPKWPWIVCSLMLLLTLVSANRQTDLAIEERQILQAANLIQSPEYGVIKGWEWLARSLAGDVLGVPLEERAKLELVNSEFRRVETEYRTARNCTLVFLLGSVLMAGVGVWRHKDYNAKLHDHERGTLDR